jgi:hypothetical protein
VLQRSIALRMLGTTGFNAARREPLVSTPVQIAEIRIVIFIVGIGTDEKHPVIQGHSRASRSKPLERWLEGAV